METKFIFLPALPEDAEAIYALWQSLAGTLFCAWSIDYPTIVHAEEDIQDNAIYLLRTQNNTLAAVGTIKQSLMQKLDARRKNLLSKGSFLLALFLFQTFLSRFDSIGRPIESRQA